MIRLIRLKGAAMKRIFIGAMSVGLLFGLSVISASAQDDQAQKIAEGKKYLEKMAAALGGRDRILKLGDSKVTAELKFLTGMGASMIRTIYTKDFSKIRIENKATGTNTNMAYNGKTGWIDAPQIGLIDMPEPVQEELKRGMIGVTNKALLNPDEFGIVVTFEGRKTIKAKEYVIIKQTYKDGHTTDIYLDAETYLPYKTAATSLNESGQKVEMESIMSDYRDVEGVKVPFAAKSIQGGVESATATFTEYKFHQNLADSLFEKPENRSK
jgi:zinc protease